MKDPPGDQSDQPPSSEWGDPDEDGVYRVQGGEVRGRRRGLRWEGEIKVVAGAEGEYLARRQAEVIREVLIWLRDHPSGEAESDGPGG
jgi:hypothetical protein